MKARGRWRHGAQNVAGRAKKEPLARMCRRPKSTEETPKEVGGNARTRIAALHQYAPAPHKKQEVLTYLFTFAQGRPWPQERVGAPLRPFRATARAAPYPFFSIGSRAPR